ncbi:MAG TPA: hypothetical protein VMV71_02920 [Candidatus Paceibacterota bacterium]|nr:hypothetical protein [Candidatus Paceibacterota bacterium]
MNKIKSFWGSVGLMAASTIGAGMFSLPYVFSKSGWVLGIFYIFILGCAIVFAHYLYWLTLERVGERQRLLGLVRARLGTAAFYVALVSVIVGLLLTLAVYLILAQDFGKMILPAPFANYGAALFWITVSLPLFLKISRFVGAEFAATAFKIAVVLFVFFISKGGSFSAPSFNMGNIFLPFGAILFSLAGWTAIEPIFEWHKKNKDANALPELALGTLISAAVYLVFIAAILGSGGAVSSDIFSGLSSWTAWELNIFIILGILAVWTPYLSISLEVKNELEKDLRMPALLSLGAVFLLPPVVFVSGIFNFIGAISIAGGVFSALQYIFIILVSKKILVLSGLKKFFADLLILVFLAAAVYEIYYFTVG